MIKTKNEIVNDAGVCTINNENACNIYRTQGMSSNRPYALICKIIQQSLESLIGKKDEKKLCPYKLRSSRKSRTLIVNCNECEHDPTFENQKCRQNIFAILLREPVIDRLIISNLYERDYERKSLEIVYSMANLHEKLTTYSTSKTTSDKCISANNPACKEKRAEILNNIIQTASSDPLKSHTMMQKHDQLYDLKDELANQHSNCSNCLDNFVGLIEEMSRLSSIISRSHNNEEKNNSDIDYERIIRSYVRPPFSTSRIYAEPPGNTIFRECYDISHRGERKLPVSIYQLTDRPEKIYVINPVEYNLRADELKIIESTRTKMIRHRPDDLQFANPSNSRNYFKLLSKRLILEEATISNIQLEPTELKLYSDILAKYTTGLGILEDLLSDERITDVYINAPADSNPIHVVLDGDECVTNVYLSQEDMDSMASRLRSISGRPFGEATPVLEMSLQEYGVRVSVIGDPLSAKGTAYAFRKHASTPWTLPRLINTGSISPLAAGLLSFIMDGQASILVAGGVGAGKTSLLSAMLLEIPQKYRILTIEDTPEIPIDELQELGWKVQGLNSQSAIMKYGVEIEPSTALRASLRLGSSSLVMGEVRGPEVSVLYEAMQVGAAGNSVIGTIHGSSTKSVYERIVHTLKVPPASFKATDAVVVCSNTRLEGSMVTKRRVIQIAETNENWDVNDSNSVFSDILTYDASMDALTPSDIMDRGQSAIIGKIADKWGISIDEALHNIRLRARRKEKMADYGKIDAIFVEAHTVSIANNMFWMFMDEEKTKRDKADLQRVYNRWSDWFGNFAADSSVKFQQSIPINQTSIQEELIAGGLSEQ
jgi:flagellar protein FlaI